MLSKVLPERASTHSPPMSILYSRTSSEVGASTSCLAISSSFAAFTFTNWFSSLPPRYHHLAPRLLQRFLPSGRVLPRPRRHHAPPAQTSSPPERAPAPTTRAMGTRRAKARDL